MIFQTLKVVNRTTGKCRAHMTRTPRASRRGASKAMYPHLKLNQRAAKRFLGPPQDLGAQ